MKINIKYIKSHLFFLKSISLILLLLLFYLPQISHDFTTRDSAEFLQTARFLDISHPPGSPLYAIFGKTAYFLGGFKGVNFLSFIFIIITFFCILKITQKLNISSIIVFPFFLLYSVRYYGTISEIYSLNICLFSIAFYYYFDNNIKLLFFSLGLLCTVTPVNIIFIIPFFIFEFKDILNEKKHILFFILPLLLWFYIPLRSVNNPPIDYGNADNIIRTIDHVRGKNFKVAANVLDFSKDMFVSNSGKIIYTAFKRPELYIIIILLFFYLNKKHFNNKKHIIFLFIMFFVYILFFLMLSLRIEHSTHFLLPAILALYLITSLLCNKNRIFVSLIFTIFFIVNIFPVKIDNSKFVKDFTDNVIYSIKEPAILFTSIDNRNFYFQFLKNSEILKKDIVFINMLNLKDKWYIQRLAKNIKIPQISSDNIEFNLNSIIEMNKDNRNIYFDNIHPLYNLYSQGLIFQYEKTSFSNKRLISDIAHKKKINITLYNDPELYNIMVSYDIMFNDFIKNNPDDNEIIKEFQKWIKFYTGVFY